MRPTLLDRFLDRLRREYPDFPLSVRPYQSPDDETIEHFIDILLVPEARLHEVGMRAWELAIDVYGDEHTPFLMTSVCPESSVEHFAQELREFRAGLGADTFVEALSRIDFDPEWLTITCSTETVLSSPMESPFQWIEPDASLSAPWLSVQELEFFTAGPVEPLLLSTSLTKLPTSVRPDDPRTSYPLAA